MASEIRVDKITSLSGVGTITPSSSGIDITGITTVATLKATTGIVTTLTATTGIVTTFEATTGNITTLRAPTGIVTTLTANTTTHLDDVTFTGANYNVVWDKSDNSLEFADNVKAKFGSGDDTHLYHNGSHTYISHRGTGDLILEPKEGENGVVLKTDGAVELYHNNIKTFQTTNEGATFDTGSSSCVVRLTSNTDAVTVLQGFNSDFTIKAPSGGGILLQANAHEDAVKCVSNGAVELFHDNTKQCETSANGLAFPSGKGIDFSATSDGSSGSYFNELLDDYEEGVFTPTWNAGGGVTFSYSQQHGWYTKIGDTVTFHIYLQGYASTITGGNSGNQAKVTGLPFSCRDVNRYYPPVTIGRTYKMEILADKRVYAYQSQGSTDIYIIQEQNDHTGTNLTAGQLDANTTEILLMGVYKV